MTITPTRVLKRLVVDGVEIDPHKIYADSFSVNVLTSEVTLTLVPDTLEVEFGEERWPGPTVPDVGVTAEEALAGVEQLSAEINRVCEMRWSTMADATLGARLRAIVADLSLAENFEVIIGRRGLDIPERLYVQIQCLRRDVVTGEMGHGRGGKADISEHATDSEIVQTIFGLYKAYWEHEARETFEWRGRRVFGPHISTEALWEIANRTDARKQPTGGDDS